jgi:glycosidase
MPWEDPDSPNKGFTTGRSWLPVIAPPEGTAAEQETDPRSTLHLTRQLIALKHRLPTDDLRFRPDSPPGVLLLSRGDYTIAINLGDNPVAIDRRGDIVLEGIPAGAEGGASLGPHTAFVSLH